MEPWRQNSTAGFGCAGYIGWHVEVHFFTYQLESSPNIRTNIYCIYIYILYIYIYIIYIYIIYIYIIYIYIIYLYI